jgi:S-DNA-T family DNA segregation ATPase FtsK/SpoIIIE
MATARPTRTTSAPRKPQPPRSAAGGAPRRRANARFPYDLVGVSLIAVGLIILATLISFPGEGTGENLLGRAVVRGLRYAVGSGSWAFPIVLIAGGTALAAGKSRSWDNIAGMVAAFLIFVTWRQLWAGPDIPLTQWSTLFTADAVSAYGGAVGALLSGGMRAAVGVVGAHILLASVSIIAGLWITDVPLPSLLGPIDRLLGIGATASRRALADGTRNAVERVAERRLTFAEAAAARAEARDGGPRPRLFSRPEPKDIFDGDDEDDADEESELGTVPEPFPTPEPAKARASFFPIKRGAPASGPMPEPEHELDPIAAAVQAHNLAAPPAPFLPTSPKGVDPNAPSMEAVRTFKLPPTTLLKPSTPPAKPNAGESEQRRAVLLQTLEDFGVGADIADVAYGPTFTRYEVALERGIKVSKIVSLADNLAMALAAIDVRVEAPIPGKSAIGIEVPNETATMVTLREVIERPEFINAPSKLMFALGKDVTGTCRFADLAKMPHLLIGGSTGSGKSVGINTLICSLLYRCTPRELKFLMIDPKKVELSLYDGIPHLAAPVITNVKQAPSIFKQALKEMESRYDRFAKAGTRNLEGYNSRVTEEERLPYWVIVVDELADLMMTAGPEIEQSICRLAQLSRATGIHLVIATQRPSVNVITGTIKANISSRIAFAVNSAVDSRTILDMTGADRLVGRGDMLFMPIDAAKPQRIQGCFVSEQETEALVSYLKQQAQPNYEVLPSTLSLATGDDESGDADPDDDLFESAVKLVVGGGGASTSMLQRRFKIGYTRAARLVDLMEQRGIVGPLDGAKPRDVLMSRDDAEAMFLRMAGVE